MRATHGARESISRPQALRFCQVQERFSAQKGLKACCFRDPTASEALRHCGASTTSHRIKDGSESTLQAMDRLEQLFDDC